MPRSVVFITASAFGPYGRLAALAAAFARNSFGVACVGLVPPNGEDSLPERGDPSTVAQTFCRMPPLFPGSKLPAFAPVTALAVDLWARWPCEALQAALRQAELVILESGPASALLDRIRAWAMDAKLIYFATESLNTTKLHPRIGERLDRNAGRADLGVTMSRRLLAELQAFGSRAVLLPQAFDMPAGVERPCGFGAGRNAVAVVPAGTSASALQVAASDHPDVAFHLFGTVEHSYPANVRPRRLDDAPLSAFMRHADLALFAGRGGEDGAFFDLLEGVAACGHFGVPVVLPFESAADHPLCFGYDAGRSGSIRSALSQACAARARGLHVRAPSWDEIATWLAGPDLSLAPPAAPMVTGVLAHAG